MPDSFLVNWVMYGAVTVEAESKKAARQIVSRTSLAKLLTIGQPAYELEIHIADDSDGDSTLSEQELRGPTDSKSMVDLFGE